MWQEYDKNTSYTVRRTLQEQSCIVQGSRQICSRSDGSGSPAQQFLPTVLQGVEGREPRLPPDSGGPSWTSESPPPSGEKQHTDESQDMNKTSKVTELYFRNFLV